MPIRMTGLTSGLDTESIVNALMSAQRTKQTKVENKKQKLEWKQEIWKGLNTKIYGFYKDSLSKMKYASNYSTKKAAVSDSTKLTATASTKAAAGSYKVEIHSIASAQYVTSGKLSTYKDSDGNDKTATSSTKLNDLGMTSGTVLKLKVGDKSTALEVNDSTTIDDFVKFCSDAGLNATFDEKQQRFFLSSKDSGSENSFELSANDYSGDGKNIINNINDSVGLSNLTSEQKKTYNSIVYGAISAKKEISSEDIATLQTLAKSSADAEATSKATAFYRAKMEKGYTISDEAEKAIREKYKDDTTLTDADKETAIQKEIDEKKKTEIDAAMATDESKAAIAELVKKGITDATVTNQEGTPVQGFVEVAAGADGKIAYDTKIFTATKPRYLSGVGQAVIPALNKGQFAIIPVSIYLQKEVDAAKDVAVNEDPSTVVITPVDKSETVSKEAGEEPVSFDYEFEAEDGQQVTNVEKVIEWIDTNHPVTKALSDAEVNKVLKALVNSLNSGIEKKKFVETIKIYPYTKLVSVDIVTKYKTSNNTISTMVDGTLYTIPDVQIRKVESVVATPNIISIGHGHGHGHGDGNNAGGGDAPTE